MVTETRTAPVLDEVTQAVYAVEAPGLAAFGDPEHRRAERGVQLGILRYEDELLDRHVFRIIEAAIAPSLRNALTPAILQERQARSYS